MLIDTPATSPDMEYFAHFLTHEPIIGSIRKNPDRR